MPTPIMPIYRTDAPNRPIDIGRFEATLRYPGGTLTADTNLILSFLPSPRFEVRMRADPTPLYPYVFDPITHDYTLEIPHLKTQFTVLQPSFGGSDAHITLRPNRAPVEVFYQAEQEISEIIIHVVNLYDFRGGRDHLLLRKESPQRTEIRSMSYLRLNAAEWEITLHALENTEGLVRHLNSDGGYAITHVARIARRDAGRFAPSDGATLMEALRFFLSFARGTFVNHVLPVGIGPDGRRWGQLGSHMIYPWGYYHGWFAGPRAFILEEIFPGFWRLYNTLMWRKPLQHMLYWYLRANNTSTGGGVDGGIILIQAALEKLAWIYCVEDRRLCSRREFKSLKASGMIAEMLDAMNVPKGIPSELTALHALGQRHGWQHGPKAFTEVRNELVHTRAKYASQAMPYFEAWNLGQWYLELSILRLAGHNGEYVNRVRARWTTETEVVPWAI